MDLKGTTALVTGGADGIGAGIAERFAAEGIHRVRLASVAIGIGFVLYLLYAELIEIGRICPYCTSVHIITLALFCLIVFQTAMRPAPPR